MFYGKRSRQLKPRAIWPSGVKGAALRALVPLPRSKGTAPAAQAVQAEYDAATNLYLGADRIKEFFAALRRQAPLTFCCFLVQSLPPSFCFAKSHLPHQREADRSTILIFCSFVLLTA